VLERPVRARLDPDGRQVVDVAVDGGYQPDAIVARAGVPLRLVFSRDDDDACSERVVFSDPRLDRRLASMGVTVIDLPARPPGAVRFTCGMGRYRGSIEFAEERLPSTGGQLRDQARHLQAPLGTAFVRWLWSLPIIAVVAVLAFDLTSAIVAAGASLTAWVAGCLWAYGRSVESRGNNHAVRH